MNIGRTSRPARPCGIGVSAVNREAYTASSVKSVVSGRPARCSRAFCGRVLGDHLSAAHDMEPRRAQANRLDRVARLQHDEVGVAAGLEPVAVEAHQPGGVDRHRVERGAHAGEAGHVRDMQAHRRDLEHVARAHRIERIDHAVVAEGDGEPGRHQLRHAGQAASLGIGVVAALQGDVDQRVGDHAELGPPPSSGSAC